MAFTARSVARRVGRVVLVEGNVDVVALGNTAYRAQLTSGTA